jgi:hypothetical protein
VLIISRGEERLPVSRRRADRRPLKPGSERRQGSPRRHNSARPAPGCVFCELSEHYIVLAQDPLKALPVQPLTGQSGAIGVRARIQSTARRPQASPPPTAFRRPPHQPVTTTPPQQNQQHSPKNRQTIGKPVLASKQRGIFGPMARKTFGKPLTRTRTQTKTPQKTPAPPSTAPSPP